ncbi:hypothetical protein [Actinacidiphila sp. bgisy160]|uniref:hypothetical protein n=1 Tax=Actinacidiphila sp. bgisy160 TaxID=3413796 RepID=UPI003D71AD5E
MHKRIGAAVAGTAAALLLVTACGGSNGYNQAGSVAPAAQQQDAAQSPTSQPGSGSSSSGYGYDSETSADPSSGTGDGYAGGADDISDSGSADAASDKKWPILSVVNDAKLGDILVDFKGRTLYRFDKDTDWPMVSNCTGECLKKWPAAKPVTKAQAEAAGLNPKLVSTYTRPDGTKQLSYNCWPVYWYVGDTKPGDTNGHAVGGTWWAMGANGKKANGGKPIR